MGRRGEERRGWEGGGIETESGRGHGGGKEFGLGLGLNEMCL